MYTVLFNGLRGSLIDKVGDFILTPLRYIVLAINSLVYSVARFMYRVFFLVTRVRIFDFSDPNTFGQITKRIYVVLGVVMLFVLAINVLRLIADPDKMAANDDKSLTGIAKNTVISIILIILLPFMIDVLDRVEERVLESNIIGNIILMSSTTQDDSYNDFKEHGHGKIDTRDAGNRVALAVFSAFFHPVYYDENGNDIAISPADCRANNYEDKLGEVCADYLEAYDNALEGGSLSSFMLSPKLESYIISQDIEFYWLWALAVGCFVAYIFLSFAIDVGARSVKLMALELLAPIPIFLRITKPTGGIFSKWFDEVKKTYLLVFIRVATVYFAVFTISYIRENAHIFNVVDTSYTSFISLTKMVAKAIIYISILQFAKTAPKLLDNIVGGLAKGEWRIGKKLSGEDYDYARRAITAQTANALNTFKAIPDILSRRDPHGNKVSSRWKALGSHLYNAPAATIHGYRYGWKNGGKVDFSQGLGKGLKDVGREAVNTVGQVQGRLDKSFKFRKSGAFTNKDGKEVIMPFISHAAGALNRVYDVFDQRNMSTSGNENIWERLSNRMNRNLGSASGKIAREMSGEYKRFIKRYDRGVEETKANYESEMRAYENHYREQQFDIEDKIKEIRRNKRANISTDLGTGTIQSRYTSFAEARSNYLANLETINKSSMSTIEKQAEIDKLDDAYRKELVKIETAVKTGTAAAVRDKEMARIDQLTVSDADKNSLRIQAKQKFEQDVAKIEADAVNSRLDDANYLAEMSKMEAFFNSYDQLILDEEREIAEIDGIIKAKRKSISAESKREQFATRAKNMLDPKFEKGRIEWARDSYDFFRERADKISLEELNKVINDSLLINKDDGSRVAARSLAEISDAVRTGTYVKETIDSSGNRVQTTVKLDGDFVMCLDNLAKNLDYLADNNDSGVPTSSSSEGKKDGK